MNKSAIGFDPEDPDPNSKLADIVKMIDNQVICDSSEEQHPFLGVKRQDILINILVETIAEDFDLEISHEYAEDRVRKTLADMSSQIESPGEGYEDPVSRFRIDWPELSEENNKRFSVFIPLPLRPKPKSIPDRMQYGENLLCRATPDDWRKYFELANESTPTQTRGYPNSPEEFIQGSNLNGISPGRYTFWKFESTGNDADFVIHELESILDVFLGKINYATNEYHQLEFDSTGNRIKRAGRTIIEYPPMYMMFQDGAFHRLQPKNTDIFSPIPSIQPVGQYDTALDSFPELVNLGDAEDPIFAEDKTILNKSIENQLGASFRTIGQALTTRDPETAFLSLYRTLEHVTFTRNAQSITPLERALRLVDANGDQYLDLVVKSIKNRRNTLVHEGTDVGITVGDLNFLKGLCITSMRTLGQVADEYSREEILTYITTEDVDSKIQDLETEIEDLEEELECYECISDWR
ncbi:hypothetical protein ACNO8S_02535 [Haloarcula sp. KBTZ06]|uniref:hypothetical protein n=1 Tax=Haloarcula sp. KBTZ06 TaxID=3402682 RepID=UPI003B42F6C4